MTTSVLDQKVSDIAARSADAVRVLEKLGIDYCCGGKQTLAEVCASKGLKPQEVAAAIDQAGVDTSEKDWRTAPLQELTAHIVSKHHDFLRSEMPLLSARLLKVVAVHGAKDNRLEELKDTFEEVRMEMDSHMDKEEMMLFPFIERMEVMVENGMPMSDNPFGTVRSPIQMMEMDHESARQGLVRMRELTDGYELPEFACGTVQALWMGLENFERDMHLHLHLENNILHPRAIALEEKLH